jgi:hypothetical protein
MVARADKIIGWKASDNNYEAKIERDGCLTSLSIGGFEFLKSDVANTRGGFFYQDGILSVPKFESPANNIVITKGDKATARYEFFQTYFKAVLTNLTDKPMSYYFVFDPAADTVLSDKDECLRLPTNQAWTTATFSIDKYKVRVLGANKIWGPFSGQLEVCETILAPHETRTLTLDVGAITDSEATVISKVARPKLLPEADLTVISPKNLQVFQRSTRYEGAILVSGRVLSDFDKVEVRITGKSLKGNLAGNWQSVPMIASCRSFNASVPTNAGGWYKLEVRAIKGSKVVGENTIDKVGVGEVFVGAGQSNSTNYGQFRTKQNSGMVSSFSGTNWQIANDPQPGAHDNSPGGSFWPTFGDTLYERYKVPIGVTVTGHGGTSVIAWQPGGELFNFMVARIRQLGPNGFRAVLWHQGESDVQMTSEFYARYLGETIQVSKKQAGWEFPWFVAQVSYQNQGAASFASTRNAQKMLWDKGFAIEGPDTDVLTGDNRDIDGRGVHLSPKGLAAHGKMWADKVGAYIDTVLGK